MKTAGIIAEYNPVHLGHMYHINETKKAGATHIVCVLGSSFTQRGDISILSKWQRAEMALLGGCDLVLELPVPWSMSSAANFALGGVSVLRSLGAVDMLSFGSECGDINLLKKAVQAAKAVNVADYMKDGTTFASARQKAVSENFGEDIAQVLATPNNILATEYINAAGNMDCMTVRRIGASHDSYECSEYQSASFIREMIAKGKNDNLSIPDFCRSILKNIDTADVMRLETSILCKLKLMKKSDFVTLPDISEGIENRLFAAVQSSTSLTELFETIKTKRYTMARVRRLVLSAFLNVDNANWMQVVPYIRVLGIGEKGNEILRAARDAAALPIIMQARDGSKIGERAKNVMETESRATDMYYMALEKPLGGGLDYTNNIIRKF